MNFEKPINNNILFWEVETIKELEDYLEILEGNKEKILNDQKKQTEEVEKIDSILNRNEFSGEKRRVFLEKIKVAYKILNDSEGLDVIKNELEKTK